MGKLYIAYGSNLNMRQMYGRCPGAKFLGTGVIENYALQFKGSPHGAHATIAPQEGAVVPVGIWRIQKRDEKSLDLYEGYHEKGYCYYDKEQIPVKFENGMQIKGMVYIMDKTKDFEDFEKKYLKGSETLKNQGKMSIFMNGNGMKKVIYKYKLE